MTHKPRGNGSSKLEVHQDDMGGWVRIHTDHSAGIPDDLAVYLSHALTQWLRQRPQYTLQCVVPIVRDGSTVELHAWYASPASKDSSEPKRPGG